MKEIGHVIGQSLLFVGVLAMLNSQPQYCWL